MGETVAAVGDHHREITQHHAGIVDAHLAERGCTPTGGRAGQGYSIGELVDQQAARVIGHAGAVSAD
ncbi:MAG TPA: hypothetical protein VMU65_16475 [Candidatus Saccharimonadales bacterium]|nr:hypothetical protein [Candidatus Saccharimonadales bacterium]